MKKMSEITGSRSKCQQGTELTSKLSPLTPERRAETWYPPLASGWNITLCLYSMFSSVGYNFCLTIWLVNTLIPITGMTTVILRKVMGFCASAIAKLVPNSSPSEPKP